MNQQFDIYIYIYIYRERERDNLYNYVLGCYYYDYIDFEHTSGLRTYIRASDSEDG